MATAANLIGLLIVGLVIIGLARRPQVVGTFFTGLQGTLGLLTR